MKYLSIIGSLVLILVLTNSPKLRAQTFVGVSFGVKLSNLQNDNDDLYNVENGGFSHTSLLYGIRVDQQLSKKFRLSLRSAFAKVNTPVFDTFKLERPENRIRSIDFNHLEVNTLLSYYLKNWWSVGIGTHIGFVNHSKVNFSRTDSVLDGAFNKREYGFNFATSFNIKNYSLELGYTNALIESFKNDNFSSFFEPIKSIYLTFNYTLKVIDKRY